MKRPHVGIAGLAIMGSCLADPCVDRTSAELDRQPRRMADLIVGERALEGSLQPERPCGMAGCAVPPASDTRRRVLRARPLAATAATQAPPEPEAAFEPPRPGPVTRYLPRRRAPHLPVPEKNARAAAPPEPSYHPTISTTALGIGFAGLGIGAIGMAVSEDEPSTEAWVLSGVFFALGTAAFATSIVFAVTEEDSVGVALGPGALEIRGSF